MSRTTLVQSGPRSAKIVIVGEAPGATEEQCGIPFSGGSGKLLDRILGNNGINRDDCFVTNVAHVRPPKNEFKWFLKKENNLHLLKGIVQLKRDIEEIKPNVVLALGGQALQALTGKQGIDKWRGSILPSRLVSGQKVLGTYHPAYILRVWDYLPILEFDIKRCFEESHYPDLRLPQRELILNPPRETHASLIEELSHAEWLGVDIECTAQPDGKWRLACVGFSDKAERAVVFPINGSDDIETVRALCMSPAKKVLQNGTFDATVLAQNGIELVNFVWDTMLAHHALFPECASSSDEISMLGGKKRQSAIQKGLAFQTSLYTREPFYKDDGKLWQDTGDLQMFWRYNALDAAVTREIRDVQERELEAFGTMNVFLHEMSLVQPLMEATAKGIKVDPAIHAKLVTKYNTEIENLQGFLDKSAGTPINVKSSKQVQTLLYDQLGLPTQYKRGTGQATADKDAIHALALKSKHPVLLTILAIRERRDMIERYLNTAYDSDGVMRCSFDITGTRTGRLSSRRSIFGSGTNLQNQPPAIRRMYVARDGMVFVQRDYSQAEARVVAYLAHCEKLISLFNDPTRDIHTENAAMIFGKDPADVDRDTERYLAKRIVHACNYGMAAKRFMQVVNEDADTTGVAITEGQARSLIERYFMLYPEIRDIFWSRIAKDMKSSRTLTTPFGRKRQFFGRWDDKMMREAYAYIPQSTVGDLTCKALVSMHKVVPGDILLNVHDSILVECPEADAERTARIMDECMQIPIPIGGRELTIPTDCKVGRNWADKSEDNPEGLAKFNG